MIGFVAANHRVGRNDLDVFRKRYLGASACFVNRFLGRPNAVQGFAGVGGGEVIVPVEEFSCQRKHSVVVFLYIHANGKGRRGYRHRSTRMTDGNVTVVFQNGFSRVQILDFILEF